MNLKLFFDTIPLKIIYLLQYLIKIVCKSYEQHDGFKN